MRNPTAIDGATVTPEEQPHKQTIGELAQGIGGGAPIAPPSRATIVGLDIPFVDLAVLYIKLLFAAIPAGVIAWIIYRIALNAVADFSGRRL